MFVPNSCGQCWIALKTAEAAVWHKLTAVLNAHYPTASGATHSLPAKLTIALIGPAGSPRATACEN